MTAEQTTGVPFATYVVADDAGAYHIHVYDKTGEMLGCCGVTDDLAFATSLALLNLDLGVGEQVHIYKGNSQANKQTLLDLTDFITEMTNRIVAKKEH